MSARPLACPGDVAFIEDKLQLFIAAGAKFALVVLVSDNYGEAKLAGDRLGLPTHCLRWEKLQDKSKWNGGYFENVLTKLNMKLGGTNYSLISRLRPSDPQPAEEEVFQRPPASLSWLFDEPCMLMGIDVSHPEPGDTKTPSFAAVVSSLQLSPAFN
jgi:hypothetical protein